MKKPLTVFLICLILIIVFTLPAFAGGNARMPAIKAGAQRLIELQRTDSWGYGTWYWYVGDTYDATNLTGVTALGLLDGYVDTENPTYWLAINNASKFVFNHLGMFAIPPAYASRWTAPDIILVQEMNKLSGPPPFDRATFEWTYGIKAPTAYPTASALDSKFVSINRPSIWDFAFYMEAAYLSGDITWANDAAAIIADIDDEFYYNPDSEWYPLNLAAAIRGLINCGYDTLYHDKIITLANTLFAMCDKDDGVGGSVQYTAYATIAFNLIGGPARSVANSLARWLARQQQENGGWLEDGYEYPEVNGEAVRALASTIGTNFTTDGFEFGYDPVSNWHKPTPGHAIPFDE